jgi:hypothetical protein
MPRFRIPLVLAIAAAVASLVAASALGAIVKRIDSTVTLAKKNPFHGHVSSPNGGCEQVRTVKVFKKRHGPDGHYDSTTTDNDGKWSNPGDAERNLLRQGHAPEGGRRRHDLRLQARRLAHAALRRRWGRLLARRREPRAPGSLRAPRTESG